MGVRGSHDVGALLYSHPTPWPTYIHDLAIKSASLISYSIHLYGLMTYLINYCPTYIRRTYVCMYLLLLLIVSN